MSDTQKWWIDDLAPFAPKRDDLQFWPINAGEFDSESEERIADAYSAKAARLIAAAPDLLAALKMALVCAEMGDLAPHEADRFRAAIAKATEVSP